MRYIYIARARERERERERESVKDCQCYKIHKTLQRTLNILCIFLTIESSYIDMLLTGGLSLRVKHFPWGSVSLGHNWNGALIYWRFKKVHRSGWRTRLQLSSTAFTFLCIYFSFAQDFFHASQISGTKELHAHIAAVPSFDTRRLLNTSSGGIKI